MRHFTASDGARIAFEEHGEGQPLLLLHGLMANRSFFRFQAPLADSFRLISLDLRGHGESRADPATATVERLAEDVAALAGQLGLENAIGVGWSLGASVLWRVLAGPAGARFAASAIVDMTPKVLNEEGWSLGLSQEVCDARTQAIRDDFQAFAVAAGQAIFAQPLDARTEPLARWSGEEFARNDPAAIAALWESLVQEDLRPLLGRVTQPSLILRGVHSQLYGPGTADYLAATLPRAAAVEFDRSGHAPQLEEPERFNDAIRDFAACLPRVRETQEML